MITEALVAATLGMFSAVVLRYLRTDSYDRVVAHALSRVQDDSLPNDLSHDVPTYLRTSNRSIAKTPPNDEIKNLLATSGADQVLESVRDEVRARLARDVVLNQMRRIFDVTRYRLLREARALARRGNVNLVLGIATALAGLAVLLGLILRASIPVDSSPIDTYMPRLTFVVFVELLSYFFLRLYRQSLSDIKYCHNEITNAELKFAALLAAKGSNDSATLSRVADELSKTERNFVLEKGQSTVFLRTERQAQDAEARVVDLIAKLPGLLQNKQSN